MEAQRTRPSLFFAFPDGAYHYVCAECTAICCRGQGFGGSLRREMRTLLTLYPSLGAAAASRHGDVLTFHSAPPACFFLDRDNLCRIEKEHGRALKPGVCTLFPFNVFTRIGRVVAVSPHFLCPLRLQVPARPGEVEGTHATLEAAVRESGLLDEEYLEAHAPALLHSSRDARAVLKREAAFRDRCARDLGRRRFADTLRESAADPALLDGFVARAARVMGLDVPEIPERDRLDEVLLALAPPLRLGLLSLPSEAILRVLALGEGLARSTLSLSREEPTLQAAHKIITAVVPALKVLALADDPLDIPEREVKVPAMGPEVTFAAFLALREGRGPGGALAAVEKAIEPSLSLADRWVLLNYLGSQLAHVHPGRTKGRRARERAAGASPVDV